MQGQRAAGIRSLAVWFLTLGMPILFGIWLMGDEDSRELSSSGFQFLKLILLVLIGLFVSVFLIHYGASLRHKVHRSYYLYFAIVSFFTLLGVIYQGASVVKGQIIGLATLFVWTSTFISVYFLVKSSGDYRRAMRLVDFSGLAIALSVIVAYIGPQYLGFKFGEFVGEDGPVRAFGPFGDQVGFALVYFVLRSIVQGRLWLLALCGSAILMTGTVGAYISLAVGILWLVFLSAGLREMQASLRRRLLIVTAFGIIFMLGFLATKLGSSALWRIQTAGNEVGSLQQRLLSMKLGLQVFVDNPLGVGYLGFNRMGDKYDFYSVFGAGTENYVYTTHNQFLQSAVDGGVLAVCALFAFLLFLYRALSAGLPFAGDALRIDLVAGLAWLVAVAVGNQSAVWLLPTTITCHLFFLVFGLLLRAVSLQPSAARAIADGSPRRALAKA